MEGLDFSLNFALLGMAVVFSVLLVFTIAIFLTSRLVGGKRKQKQKEAGSKSTLNNVDGPVSRELVAAVAVSYYLDRVKNQGAENVMLFKEDEGESSAWRTSARRS